MSSPADTGGAPANNPAGDGLVGEIENIAGKVIAGGSAIVDKVLSLSPQQLATAIAMLSGAFFPGVTVLGMTVKQLAALAAGVAQEAPDAIAAFESIKTVAASGLPPTPEQWAQWNAAADAAHANVQAAANEVINGTGP